MGQRTVTRGGRADWFGSAYVHMLYAAEYCSTADAAAPEPASQPVSPTSRPPASSHTACQLHPLQPSDNDAAFYCAHTRPLSAPSHGIRQVLLLLFCFCCMTLSFGTVYWANGCEHCSMNHLLLAPNTARFWQICDSSSRFIVLGQVWTDTVVCDCSGEEQEPSLTFPFPFNQIGV